MDEWIEHDGKGYPDLPHDTMLRVRFADEQEGVGTVRFLELCWTHDDPIHPADITHYRVVAK